MAIVANPFGDVFTVDCSIYEVFGRLPPYLPHVYPDLAPMHALLIDPVGHYHTVKVEYFEETYWFTVGWTQMRRFYEIDVGATVRCVFVREKTFEISIRDYKGVEWIYPPIPEAVEGALLAPRRPDIHFQHDRLCANNKQFLCILIKYISFVEYTGDTFTISKGWADKYLASSGNDIYIVDEFGNQFPCNLRAGLAPETDQVVVTKGWSFFCRKKGFKQGQSVVFGVTREKSSHLFFISDF